MSGELQLKFLDSTAEVQDPQEVDELAQLMSKAFTGFNISVSAPPEVVEEEFGNTPFLGLMMMSICGSSDGYAATTTDGKIVGASFVDVRAKGSALASLGPVSSLAPGGGRKTFIAACEHAEKLGFSTLVLMQVASNPRAFSLYAKLGFKAKHACQYMGGFLSLPEPLAGKGGLALSSMTAEDVKECADLFLAAHGTDCGWDRQSDIAGFLGSGAPFPMLVARDADGSLVGYSTGFFTAGHQVAVSQEIFCALFEESSRLHQKAKLPTPRFHCPIKFPGLLSWGLAQGLTIYRATIIMAKGHYEPNWSEKGHIVAPSTAGNVFSDHLEEGIFHSKECLRSQKRNI